MRIGRIILNRNICDNTPLCSGIEICPTGALFWDENKERIEYNENTCIDCGACADECPVDAILWGIDDADYERKLQEVKNDTRSEEELVVERYGASPIKEPIMVSSLADFVQKSVNDLVLLEFYEDESINCLLHSIRVEEIKGWLNEPITYAKVNIQENDDATEYGVEEYPTLLVYRKGHILGKVSGYFTDDDESKRAFRTQLLDIV